MVRPTTDDINSHCHETPSENYDYEVVTTYRLLFREVPYLIKREFYILESPHVESGFEAVVNSAARCCNERRSRFGNPHQEDHINLGLKRNELSDDPVVLKHQLTGACLNWFVDNSPMDTLGVGW